MGCIWFCTVQLQTVYRKSAVGRGISEGWYTVTRYVCHRTGARSKARSYQRESKIRKVKKGGKDRRLYNKSFSIKSTWVKTIRRQQYRFNWSLSSACLPSCQLGTIHLGMTDLTPHPPLQRVAPGTSPISSRLLSRMKNIELG